jgi:exosortase
MMHIPVLREGNVIALAHTTLEVTEACSGIRSLVSLFALAVLYGYFTDPRRVPRILIALSSIPIAIVANGLRITGTGIAAQYLGPAATTGFLHTFSGLTVFVTSFLMLVAMANALKMRASPVVSEPEPAVS